MTQKTIRLTMAQALAKFMTRQMTVIDGRTVPTLTVWTPVPAIAKVILSAFVPLAVLLAAVIASRRLMNPSAPLFASSVLRLVVSPSLVSAAVSTVTTACTRPRTGKKR